MVAPPVGWLIEDTGLLVSSRKVAVTEALAVMVTVQVGLVPLQAPDQPPNTELESGRAVMETTVPLMTFDPERLLVIVPFPFPALLIVSV